MKANRTRIFTRWILALLAIPVAWMSSPGLAATQADGILPPAGREAATSTALPGSGDGKIHVLPVLSAVSIKNGDRAAIQAVIKAPAGVESVQARIEREEAGSPAFPVVATLKLSPAPMNRGGVNESSTAGLWQTEWIAEGLEEGWYRVAIQVTDTRGHRYTDRSLRFSDPIAGNNVAGSTAYPNGGLVRVDAEEMFFPENQLFCGVIDAANGYAYLGTYTAPSRIVKIALGTGGNAPTRLNTVTLEAGENFPRCAVIDSAAGYAYFGTETSPGRVVKIALGAGDAAPVRIGAVTLNSGENLLYSAVIDANNSYAYFGTLTIPGRIIKVALGGGINPPSRVGAVTLDTGENYPVSGIIDTASGYAYFGTFTSPGYVVKIDMGIGNAAPSRVGSVALDTGENALWSAVINPSQGLGYFGTATAPGRVIQVDLGSGSANPTRLGAVTLNSGESNLYSAVADLANNAAYFGTNTTPGRVVKVDLGTSITGPSRLGAVTLSTGENDLRCAMLDSTAGYAYFGTNTSPGQVVKLDLSGATAPSRVGAVTFVTGESYLVSAVADIANGHAYFGTSTSPGNISKVALGAGAVAPARLGAVTLNSGENNLYCAAIDTANGFAYFGTGTSPGRVVKVALGADDDPPTRVGAVTLASGENVLYSAVIDTANQYAYFGTGTSPGRVIKVALGAGTNPPTRVDAVTLNTGENNLYCAVIDTANQYAYFGTGTSPGIVVKVALGSGTSAPTRIGALALNSGENTLRSAVIDPANGYAYFGTDTSPGRVVKVALGADANPPSHSGAVTLNTGENQLRSAAINAAEGHAVFGTITSPGWAIKVALGSGGNAPTRIGAVQLATGENSLACSVADMAAGYVYLGANVFPGRVVRVALSSRGFVRASKFTLPEEGGADSVSFYSHAAAGNVRLALYDNNTPQTLLWQSAALANSTVGGWITESISSGTPSSLTLPAGDYWLAWQVDTTAGVPSYTLGSAGDGFLLPYSWGSFPAALEAGTLTEPTLTTDLWSGYITYSAPPAEPGNPGATGIGTNVITWTWQDNSSDETGFKVYAGAGATAPGTVTHTTGAETESWQQTGLAPNTQYAMQVAATNSAGDSDKTDNYTTWTLAATPLTPTLGNPTVTTLDVSITAGDGNPAGTEYALFCSPLSQWIQGDGTLGVSPVWQTAAAWGTKTITGLNGANQYSVSAQARNFAGIGTALSSSASAWTQVTLTYIAGAGGWIDGASTQTVNHGGNGTQVTAVPATGYQFVKWNDDVLTPARTDTNVVANLTVTAIFALNEYTLTYLAGSGGSIEGTTPQTVNHGGNGTQVTAVPATGYQFVKWSDDVLTPARTDTNVVANLTVTAIFAINEYTLTYIPGANGTINGTLVQTVQHGGNGTMVEAVPNGGFLFDQWSDGDFSPSRTDTNVTGNLTVTAYFKPDPAAGLKDWQQIK